MLLEGSPYDVSCIKEAILAEFDYIEDIHDIHCWEISHNYYYLTCHVVLDRSNEEFYNKTIQEVSELLENRFVIAHTTIQIEYKEN